MDRKFSALLPIVHNKLQEIGVSPDTLRIYLTSLSVSRKESMPRFGEYMAEIFTETEHSQIFGILSRIGAWSMLNFSLLVDVTEEYGDDELKTQVSEYKAEVEIFKRETKLQDFLPIWAGRSSYGSLPNSEALIAKLQGKWGDCSLADVAEVEGCLADEFLLEHQVFHFSNGEPGCVCLMWLIPKSAATLIKQAILKSRVYLKETKICELMVVGEETIIFKVCISSFESLCDNNA